jgi:transposase
MKPKAAHDLSPELKSALEPMMREIDPHRFRKSRDAACYVGLQPGRRNSGQSEPPMHISKEGDPYLRTLLVQAAHHVLGPLGSRQRPAPMGHEAGWARRQTWEETRSDSGRP